MPKTTKDKELKKNTNPSRNKKNTTVQAEDQITPKELATFGFGVSVLLLAVFAVVMLVSYTSFLIVGAGNEEHNALGDMGRWIADTVFTSTFGLGTYLFPVFLIAVVLRVCHIGKIRLWKWFINCSLIMVWLSVTGAFIQETFDLHTFFAAGGLHGKNAVAYLTSKIGELGTGFILLLSAAIYILYLSGETVHTFRRIVAATQRRKEAMAQQEQAEAEAEQQAEENATQMAEETDETEQNAPVNTATTIEFEHETEAQQQQPLPELEMEISVGDQTIKDNEVKGDEHLTIGEKEPEAQPDETGALEPYDPKLDLENYKYPTHNLLKHYDTSGNGVDMEEQRQNKERIIRILNSFNVGISSIKATVGPTVTLYEVTPAEGVRISKIRSLEDDIALSLSALGIRIIAPIPGKGTVGIEVPNAKPQMVSMESVINSKKFQDSTYELPMVLGKTITNEIFMVDLAKMPHLLVAGATGQGKSVGLNAIITSLLYKKHPAELKLVMVDPKKVEFSVYNPIVHHFLAQVEGTEDTDEPIITDVNKVVQTLKSLCQEMDTRYDLLKKGRARNITEYNEKFKARKLNPNNGHRFMPYIVVIIDEFGDLIMTAGKEIELPIARIAQLARAVGIHMIIATQRPTTNIITGTIKANFPARMAFKVSAMIDSRTILDRPGANQLVGKGDMLFLSGSDPVRVQCAFVDTPEVESIASHIACQQSYNAPFPLPHVELEGDESSVADVDLNRLDPMFEEVARLVVNTQQGSTSMIQRKFSIGYNRAGRLMDQLEKAGIVGPAHGSKPREVLCMGDIELDMLLSNLK